jgi:hypothetical protein
VMGGGCISNGPDNGNEVNVSGKVPFDFTGYTL